MPQNIVLIWNKTWCEIHGLIVLSSATSAWQSFVLVRASVETQMERKCFYQSRCWCGFFSSPRLIRHLHSPSKIINWIPMDSVQLSMQDLHCRCRRSIAKRRIDCVDWTACVDPKVLTFQDVTKNGPNAAACAQMMFCIFWMRGQQHRAACQHFMQQQPTQDFCCRRIYSF